MGCYHLLQASCVESYMDHSRSHLDILMKGEQAFARSDVNHSWRYVDRSKVSRLYLVHHSPNFRSYSVYECLTAWGQSRVALSTK